jgi:hypothetical protein
LCDRKEIAFDREFVAFISGHGSSQQATGFTILRSWSPLSKIGAIFDYDKAGRDDGAKRIKAAVENRDYFYLPHAAGDVVLEDLYSVPIKTAAEKSNTIAQRTITENRPDGTELSKTVEWNKDQLAQYFVANATDVEWQLIESFVKNVVETVSS